MLAVMNWINCSPEKTRKSDFRAQQIKTPATYLLAFFCAKYCLFITPTGLPISFS
ncbi:hypothetical protein EDC53_112163 [Phytobacter diazotrophicus]|nr:hypothetical protein EDC53_112163 [Phytobacter diazotrophicus]